jgi:DNA-binding MarR family transcriptional regulator
MGLLDNRVASPRQLAIELGSPLSLTSYHVRQLAQMGLVELVSRRQKRGSIEHFYTAVVRPRLYDDVWARIPAIVKRAIIGGRLAQLGKELTAAAERGGFDREDIHLTRTRLSLTPEGWRTVARELSDLLGRLDRLGAEERARLEADTHAERVEATVAMMAFESPPPSAFEIDENAPVWHDDMPDIAQPL